MRFFCNLLEQIEMSTPGIIAYVVHTRKIVCVTFRNKLTMSWSSVLDYVHPHGTSMRHVACKIKKAREVMGTRP